MTDENKYISQRKIQRADKPTIHIIAQQQLDGESLMEFKKFLDFLKEEKISLPWKSINGFKMKYKSKNIGAISLGAGGWLDNAIETKNYIHISIETAGWDKFDNYLEEQSDEIISLFMECISNKCVHCRPTCGCSQASGNNFILSGKQYENVCFNAPGYKFIKSGGDLQTMIMCSPCAVYPPIRVRSVPLDTVKNLIIARKKHIERC